MAKEKGGEILLAIMLYELFTKNKKMPYGLFFLKFLLHKLSGKLELIQHVSAVCGANAMKLGSFT